VEFHFLFFHIPHMSLHYIKTSAVKKLANTHGKRAGKGFLEALDRLVERKVLQALAEHNGNKKTLDEALAGYVLGNK
jgi:hypothetical protein